MAEIRSKTRARFAALPLIVCAGAIVLLGKVGDAWLSAGEPALGIGAPAYAAEKTPAPPPAPVAKKAGEDPASEAAKPAAVEDPAFDPTRLTAGEFKLLQQLAERRKALDAREQGIELREKTTRTAERRVEERIGELKSLKVQVEALLRQHDEQQERQLRALVKIYETMKPKEAARIFDDLEMAVLISVIERMKEAKTAPVMASMNPGKAKAVTVELAERRKLPEVGG